MVQEADLGSVDLMSIEQVLVITKNVVTIPINHEHCNLQPTQFRRLTEEEKSIEILNLLPLLSPFANNFNDLKV